jgi:hypothetical protein
VLGGVRVMELVRRVILDGVRVRREHHVVVHHFEVGRVKSILLDLFFDGDGVLRVEIDL